MVALARDFHVFCSGITTRIAAIFLSSSYIAKARYVRTLSRHLTRHLISFHYSLNSSHLFLIAKMLRLSANACKFPNINLVIATGFPWL